MVNLFDFFFYKLWPAVHRFIATFFVLVISNWKLSFLTQLLQSIIPIAQFKIIGNVFGNWIFVLIAITHLWQTLQAPKAPSRPTPQPTSSRKEWPPKPTEKPLRSRTWSFRCRLAACPTRSSPPSRSWPPSTSASFSSLCTARPNTRSTRPR